MVPVLLLKWQCALGAVKFEDGIIKYIVLSIIIKVCHSQQCSSNCIPLDKLGMQDFVIWEEIANARFYKYYSEGQIFFNIHSIRIVFISWN